MSLPAGLLYAEHAAKWVWILTFPPPSRLRTLSKIGKFLTVSRGIKVTEVFLVKYSNY